MSSNFELFEYYIESLDPVKNPLENRGFCLFVCFVVLI